MELVQISNARRALAEAKTFTEIRLIRDQAEALRQYLAIQGGGREAANDCAEIMLLAERDLGAILATMEKAPAGRPSDNRSQAATDLPPTLAELGILKDQSSRWQAVARVPEERFSQYVAEAKAEPLGQVSRAGLLRDGAHVGHNAGENEWYTPLPYIEAARATMGAIDLDPASHDDAQSLIRAGRYYTFEDDGLTQEWHGRVWLNPPYAQPMIGNFCRKLIDSIGPVSEAITLTNNATETGWGQVLLLRATAVCFPSGRVKFWAPGRESFPLQGQMLCYYGEQSEAFRREFGEFGVVR